MVGEELHIYGGGGRCISMVMKGVAYLWWGRGLPIYGGGGVAYLW